MTVKHPKVKFPSWLDLFLAVIAVGMGWNITYAASHDLPIAEFVCIGVLAIVFFIFVGRALVAIIEMKTKKMPARRRRL